uniref:Deoxynucleotidyltransferase terminal-interacting protein 1 n=1 Tax=Sus scrofa TaxID=9823 RepID=A0A4X1U096_PIG
MSRFNLTPTLHLHPSVTDLGDLCSLGPPQNPWNIMIKHRQVQRRGRRSQMTTSFTDPAISMDLLRAVLQPSINEEIQTVFNKYMKFFQKAALNVRDNIGEEVDAEQLIQEACRSCLEQAKLLFSDGEKVIPRLTHELPGIKRGRQAEEEGAHRGSPIPKKRKGRPPGHILSNDRAAAGMVWKPKSCEPIRREGPKWDPARLNETTTFVLGSRANKALGMGGTRGRIYIKHPHLFKYAADPQDKHWLAEQHHMRATGGKMVSIVFTCPCRRPTQPWEIGQGPPHRRPDCNLWLPSPVPPPHLNSTLLCSSYKRTGRSQHCPPLLCCPLTAFPPSQLFHQAQYHFFSTGYQALALGRRN